MALGHISRLRRSIRCVCDPLLPNFLYYASLVRCPRSVTDLPCTITLGGTYDGGRSPPWSRNLFQWAVGLQQQRRGLFLMEGRGCKLAAYCAQSASAVPGCVLERVRVWGVRVCVCKEREQGRAR